MNTIENKIEALEHAEKVKQKLKESIIDLNKDIEGLKQEIRELRGKENGTIEN